MKHHLAFFTLCGTLLTTGQHATAQVFIPDTLMRNWLNGSIPGIVDANGIMDTSHVGIATLDSVYWMAGTTGDLDVDLTGMQYLHSATYVHINIAPTGYFDVLDVVCPAIPPAARQFTITLGQAISNLELPVLRSPLQEVFVSTYLDRPIALSIAAIEDTLTSLNTGPLRSLNGGPSTGYIENLFIQPGCLSFSDTLLLIAPDWDCGNVMFYMLGWGHTILDMAAMSCQFLDLNDGAAEIQSWPAQVKDIHVDGYGIDYFPPWPSTLRDLSLYLTQNACLPMFPNELRHLNAAFVDCIPNVPDSLEWATGNFIQGGDTLVCSIINSECPGSAAAIAGRHVIDSNANGQADPGEPIFPWGQVAIQPMNGLVPGGVDGCWERGAFPGTYTITPVGTYPYVTNTAPAQHTATFINLGEVDSTNHFAHVLLPGVNDLRLDIVANVARPGFDNIVHLAYENYGTTTLTADLQLTFDTDQSWVGSTPAPTTQSANTANWAFPNLPPGVHGQIAITLHTDAAVPIGTALLHTAAIDPLTGDTTPANNTTNWVDTVVGAYDPNDKLLDTPTAALTQVQADNLDLTYTIRFQNTGTYQAERVVIVDTLSDQLQWSTFQFLGSSHACDWYMLDGVLHFIFDPILLPDSGSNEAGSHGFVCFSMRPSTQLQLGETVSNIAHIVFDFNEAIVTLPAVFLVDNLTSVPSHGTANLIVMPNPTRDRLRVDGFSGTARYVIRDIGGRVTQSGSLNGSRTIGVARLSPGTYFLEVEQDTSTRTVRFVRER